MKPFRLWFVVPVLALLALLSAASIVSAQSSDERLKQESVKDEGVKDDNASKPRVPNVTDWSHHYLIYSNTEKIANSHSPRAEALRENRRFQQALAHRKAMANGSIAPIPADLGSRALLPAHSLTTSDEGKLTRDWTSSLTTSGTVGNEQYPAKFSFNINTAPSCTADFAVFNNDQSSGTHGTGFVTDASDIGIFYGVPATNSVITIDGVTFTATNNAADINGVGEPLYYCGNSTCKSTGFFGGGTAAATNLVKAINAYATANPAFTFNAANAGGGGFFGAIVRVTDTVGGTGGNGLPAAPSGCFFGFGTCPTPNPDFFFFSPTFFGGRGGTVANVANVIGLNQLYTGTSPAGICTGSAPNVMFAYGVSTEGGLTSVSPALSEDGTQLAIVESTPSCVNITGTCKIGSYLHLIKWAATTNAPITGTVKVPNTATATTYRSGCTLPCMLTLPISSTATVSNSAPFVDYADDRIYVGDDAGVLHVYNGVFVGTPSAGWTSSIDPGFALTGPVFDQTSGNIYVADANGILSTVLASNGSVIYQVQTTGAQGPSEVGTTGFPIPDPPIVDGSAETVTVFVSNDGGATGAPGADLDQFVICDAANAAALGSSCTVGGAAYATGSAPQIGPAGVQMHDGDFDNTYYSGSYADGYLYFCGKTPGPGPAPDYATGGIDIPTIERAYFDSNGFLINVDYVSTPLTVGLSIGVECSPMTEVMNGSDKMFFSVQAGGIGTNCGALGGGAAGTNPSEGCLMSIVVNDDASPTATSPSAMPTGVTSSIGEPGGTSGIIIDNISSSAQASSVYFSPLGFATSTANGNCGSGIGCAVKATQNGLN